MAHVSPYWCPPWAPLSQPNPMTVLVANASPSGPEYHTQRGFDDNDPFLSVLKTGKSEIKMPADPRSLSADAVFPLSPPRAEGQISRLLLLF